MNERTGKQERQGLKIQCKPLVPLAFFGQPDDTFDQINCYGTYEIQRTSDTENLFPMIAQGLPKAWDNLEIDKPGLKKEDEEQGYIL